MTYNIHHYQIFPILYKPNPFHDWNTPKQCEWMNKVFPLKYGCVRVPYPENIEIRNQCKRHTHLRNLFIKYGQKWPSCKEKNLSSWGIHRVKEKI